jgi:hypothetical protein
MKKLLALVLFLLVSGMPVFAQGNSCPFATVTLNNQPVSLPSPILEFFPGDSMHLRITATDNNPGDSVKVSSNVAAIIPGTSLTVNNAKLQTATINWVPTSADVRLVPYSIELKLIDNHTPIRCFNTILIQVRVNQTGSVTLNNAPVNLNREIELHPGSPFNFRVSSVNTNLTDSIRITSNVTSVLPGVAYSVDNAKQQTAILNWTPTVAHVNAQPYIFTVTLRDNSTPAARLYIYTVKVRVSNLLSAPKEKQVIQTLSAYPNPFSETVNFRIGAEVKGRLVIYNALGMEVDRILLPETRGEVEPVSWENAGKMPAGNYVARLISDSGLSQSLKFIKLR